MARKMTKAGYSDASHALLVARTESMRVAQEVGNENFKANGVDMVQWVSGETPYTCAACWAMSGKVFETGKQPHDHPNGRCVFNPYIPELAELDPDLYKHDPEENFAKLSEEEQKAVLGPKRFEMWKNGELNLTDLADTTDSDDYGESIKIRSLGDLAGGSGGGSGSGGSSSDGGSGSGGGPKNLTKTPAVEYNIDKQFTEQFNSMTPEMQGLFAPYLKEGAVSGLFDDSEVSEEIKKAKLYKNPLTLALTIQEYLQKQFPEKSSKEIAEEFLKHRGYAPELLKSFGDAVPVFFLVYYCEEFESPKKTEYKNFNHELLREWENSSGSAYSMGIRKAASVLYGGEFYNPEGIEPNSYDVAFTAYVIKNIYDESREYLNAKATGNKIFASRGYFGDFDGAKNSVVSWSFSKDFVENWADNLVLEKIIEASRDKSGEFNEELFIENLDTLQPELEKKRFVIDKNFEPDFVLTCFGAISPGLEKELQQELIVLGGAL
ncbi:MAG: hypothetical protein KBT47_09180 [Armatimonadetes bacterium]|nr:hypothetical protein [Candidatus Hippobium faecium]